MHATAWLLLAGAAVARAVTVGFYPDFYCNPGARLGGGGAAQFRGVCTVDGYLTQAASVQSCGNGKATINIHALPANGAGPWPYSCGTTVQYTLPDLTTACTTVTLQDPTGQPFQINARLLETECDAPAPVYLVGWRSRTSNSSTCRPIPQATYAVVADGRCRIGGPSHSSLMQAKADSRPASWQGYYRANASSDGRRVTVEINDGDDCRGTWYRLGDSLTVAANGSCTRVSLNVTGYYGTFTNTDTYMAFSAGQAAGGSPNSALPVAEQTPTPVVIAGVALGTLAFVVSLSCVGYVRARRMYGDAACGGMCASGKGKGKKKGLVSIPAAYKVAAEADAGKGGEAVALTASTSASVSSAATLNPIHTPTSSTSTATAPGGRFW